METRRKFLKSLAAAGVIAFASSTGLADTKLSPLKKVSDCFDSSAEAFNDLGASAKVTSIHLHRGNMEGLYAGDYLYIDFGDGGDNGVWKVASLSENGLGELNRVDYAAI